MKEMKIKFIIFTLLLTMISCSKEEGEGGKNNVEGYVMTQELRRSDSQLIAQYPSFDDNIYIIYGTNASHADKDLLSYNGHYSFSKLYKGEYTLFVYSECLSCNSGKEPIFVDFELKERKEDFVVDTIYKIKYVD